MRNSGISLGERTSSGVGHGSQERRKGCGASVREAVISRRGCESADLPSLQRVAVEKAGESLIVVIRGVEHRPVLNRHRGQMCVGSQVPRGAAAGQQ